MKKDTFLYFQDAKNLYMFWQKNESIVKREIVGIDEMFNSKVITTTEQTSVTIEKKTVKKYIEIRVNSYDKDNHIIEGTTINNKNELEKIIIKCIKSYEGLTLSFSNDYNIYDRYDLYEVTKNNKKILLTSEDFQVNSKKIKEGKKYYVEAFNKENDNFILKATSDIYTCQIDKIEITNNKPKLSIIIPAYNTDFFLPRTLDSVLFSSLKDYEIIIIDDGSTDKGPEIIDWYSQKYKGVIRGYHQENQGLSFARNNGTKLAKGKFIAYLDSDDLVHYKMYEELYNAAIFCDAPIAIGKTLVRNKINEHHIVLDVPNPTNDKYRIYTFEEMLENKVAQSQYNIFFVAVWNKIIRADIAQKHLFPKSNYYEDSAYTPMIYSYIDKFAFAYNAFYIWDQRRRKTTGTYSITGYDFDWKKIHKAYINAILYAEKKGNIEKKDEIYYLILHELRSVFETNSKMKDEKSGIYRLYKNTIKRVNKKANFLDNKYIQENQTLYSFVKDKLE